MKISKLKNGQTNKWIGLGGITLFILFIVGLTMPGKLLPAGMFRAKKNKVTRRYVTIPELEQKMAQVSQQYQMQRAARMNRTS